MSNTHHRITKGQAHIHDGINHTAVAVEKHERHSGPLPAADEVAKYELALPGSANRIITMAEKQQDYVLEMHKLQHTEDSKTNDHTFLLNKLTIESNSRYNFWRLTCSVVVCCLVVGAGFYAIYKGAASAGATIISIPLGGIIVAFISEKISPRVKNKTQSSED